MIWISLALLPVALAMVKLGSAVTLVAVLKMALQASCAVIVMLTAALLWTLYFRDPKH